MSLVDGLKSHSFLQEESAVGLTLISVMSFWWPLHSSLSPPPRLHTTLFNWVQFNNSGKFCFEWVEVSVNCYNTARFTATSWLWLVQVDIPEWLCLSLCHSCRAGEEGEDISKPSSRRLNPIIIRNIHTRRQRRPHILTPKMCSLIGQSVMELSE